MSCTADRPDKGSDMTLRVHPDGRSGRRSRLARALLSLLILLPGCAADKKTNPSFPISINQAKAELRQMQKNPVTLTRPVVVLGGWGDVLGLPPAELARQLRNATGDPRIISIGFGGCVTFDGCRDRLLKRIEKAFPSDHADTTTEVDVIGFSMGGIVARYAATPSTEDATPRRLHVARLFTICTPHRGAFLANALPAGPLAWDMRPGSVFMQTLDEQLEHAGYPVIPYARIPDTIVGAANTSPHDQTPYWLYAQPFTRSHGGAYKDPRIVADLARRLRNETPYSTNPPAPLPE